MRTPLDVRVLVLSASVLLCSSAVPAPAHEDVCLPIADDPHLSPDNTGFITPSVYCGFGRYEPVTQCEVQVARNLDSYTNCLLSCNRWWGKIPGDPTSCEEGCEHLLQQDARLLSGCPTCLDQEARASAAETFHAWVEDTLLPMLYCDGNHPATCGDRVSQYVGNMLVCLTRAQLERAIDELRSATQEEAVEARCLSTYAGSVERLVGCPSCLDVQGVGNEILGFMNQHSNLAFCAQ